ncbi:MAG: TIGR03085 family protein [Tessaracoccus sp.]|uniref:TIGR03085 family metal-binding protein n=1 Tax=Tessaracoccus sp. TaxID=1971211 RepID=UPI001ED138E3|nr:TIGR03085 family metal-binding protein [Tessaracoccus sp.]MBK7821239.1 TIGR03085 family protein [Tessaracoccus sp.]
MSFARRQRTALADLLAELGPFAPTKCEGWKTQDLAAHLYVREHRPAALLGIGFPRFADKTARIQLEALHELGFPAIIEAIRTPPTLMKPIDQLAGASEYFIHHEDVLRANGRSQTLTPREQDELWRVVQVLARRTQLKTKGHVRLVRGDTGFVAQIGRGPQPLTVTGLPSELLLSLSGREAAVDLAGEPTVVDAWRAAISPL